MDALDQKILNLLQERRYLACRSGGRAGRFDRNPVLAAHSEIGEAGIIRGRVALLDRDKLNLGVTVFVAVPNKST
jgi:Lrp/AsnC family transcriptional regulator